jgi:predicted nucleic acid-binding protein
VRAKVYIETTVISYLTARPNQDVVIAGHQKITRDWWQTCRDKFDLVASQLVVREASAGDSQAAKDRLEKLTTLTLLEVTDEAVTLAQELIGTGAVPEKAVEDALHLAIAVTNGVEYLLTWNCTHLANATMRTKIEDVCRTAGFEPVIICTPEELLEV